MILTLFCALAASAEPALALERIPVRSEADPAAAVIGHLNEGSVFAWTRRAEGPGCESSHWAALLGGGYACMTDTEPTEATPAPLPALVVFDPPRPDEWETYLETGTWDRDPHTEEALLPFVYGKRWRDWKGPIWASLDAWNAGAPPVGTLAGGGGRKNHFTAVHETERGGVLVRVDGTVSPIDSTHIYPVDRFVGRDLEVDPVAEGWVAGWVTAYEGADLVDEPGGLATGHLDYHAAVDVREAKGRWWAVRDASGPGVLGYIEDKALRHWVDRPPVEGLDDAVWVDIDLGQQTLALRRGAALEYITLISGGLTGRTPEGIYEVLDKEVHDDMASRAGASDTYLVEEVPWVVHFWPRYAIHGAFWHWGFGHRASHGCVNLAPRDALRVFDALQPALPDGWHDVRARPEAPGSVVRIRDGQGAIPDRR